MSASAIMIFTCNVSRVNIVLHMYMLESRKVVTTIHDDFDLMVFLKYKS